MGSSARRVAFVLAIAVTSLLASAGIAFAAPAIAVGDGWADGPHTGYPGACLGCHSGFKAAAPAITQGATATHRDRGSSCGGCHVVNAPAPAPGDVPVSFVKGTDRYATAIAVSRRSFPGTAASVVLATGADFPDALCAAPLASAYRGPILLVPPGTSLPANVSAEIDRLRPSRIFVIGSDRAVSAGVASQVSAKPWRPAVTRLGGAGRFETAALVAREVKAKMGAVSKVVVAYGRNYPDALAAAPIAAAKGWPILLTETSSLPAATAGAVAESGATGALVTGSPAVVSDAVMRSLPNPQRKGGANRYETCGLLADYGVSLGMSYGTTFSTVGDNYPDALAAGPMVANGNGVLLLTAPTAVPQAISSRLSANKAAMDELVVVGGAVTPSCVASLRALVR